MTLEGKEEHFWELFDGFEPVEFQELAKLTASQYDALRRYRDGERRTRPFNRGRLVDLRESILDSLDEKERREGLWPRV